jgi:DNA topoisomerase-6 subunit A
VPEAIRQSLATLQPGDLSPVLVTGRGFALVLMEARTPAPRQLTAEQVDQRVRSRLERLAMERLARECVTNGLSVLDPFPGVVGRTAEQFLHSPAHLATDYGEEVAPATNTTARKPSSRNARATRQVVGLPMKSPSEFVEQRASSTRCTKSNTIWNKKRGILEMGDARQERELFNLNQAKVHADHAARQHDQGPDRVEKTSSLRGVFYKAKHTIAGTKENTFDAQDESDPILEDLEVTLGALREELHIFAENRGTMVGNITIVDKGDEIDCRRMGSGGYGIPSIVEPDVIQFKKCEAKFVLHVEKGTVWNRFNEDRFWEENNCILTHGAGQPPRGCRRLLQRLNQELKLPIICVLDCDPWGHYISASSRAPSRSRSRVHSRSPTPASRHPRPRIRRVQPPRPDHPVGQRHNALKSPRTLVRRQQAVAEES